MASKPYEIRLTPAAARTFKKLPADARDRIREALTLEAGRAATASRGKRGGKSVKSVRGRADRFYRLRIGDYRAMYDTVDEERVLLVLGIVHRRDLERWLRDR